MDVLEHFGYEGLDGIEGIGIGDNNTHLPGAQGEGQGEHNA